MARRAPKSTTASSQVREAAKRITTSDVGVLIWTELRRSCAAEHLVHTGRSSCECWNRLKGWYFCFWPKIFILEICYRELWARALLRVLCRTSCGLPSWALLLALARPQSTLYLIAQLLICTYMPKPEYCIVGWFSTQSGRIRAQNINKALKCNRISKARRHNLWFSSLHTVL